MRLGLADSSRLRTLVFTASYLAQGATFGFIEQGLIPYLFGANVLTSSERNGWLALATVPWALKLAVAPVIDRFGGGSHGRLRPWLLAGQVGMIVTLIGVATIAPSRSTITLLGGLILMHGFARVVQDIATDAMMFDTTPTNERGRQNAWMWAASLLGSMAIAWWLGGVLSHHGVEVATWALIGVVGLTTLPGWFVRDMTTPAAGAERRLASWLALLWTCLRRPESRWGFALALLLSLPNAVLSGVSYDFLFTRLGWTFEAYRMWLLPAGFAGSLLGYAVASHCDRWGHRRTLAAATVGLAGCWLAYAALGPWWSEPPLIIALSVVEGCVLAVLLVALHAMLMDLTFADVRATHFVVYMSLINASKAIGLQLAQPLHQRFDFVSLFVGCALVQLAMVAVVLAMRADPRRAC